MNTRICPNDTNGDGDCGRYLCPVCYPEHFPSAAAVEEAKRALYRAHAPITVDDDGVVENGHARAEALRHVFDKDVTIDIDRRRRG